MIGCLSFGMEAAPFRILRKSLVLITRMVLIGLLAWAMPASPVCEFLCAPHRGHECAHHADVGASHNHERGHARPASSDGHSHSGNSEGCCGIASSQLVAKNIDLVVELDPKRLALPHLPRAHMLDAAVTASRTGSSPGLALDVFSQRNRPLLN